MPEWLTGSKPARCRIAATLVRISGIFCTDWLKDDAVNRPTIRTSPSTRFCRNDLDADVIHVVAPVHARLHVRLGHDQRLRSQQERLDLRRHRHQLGAAPQHLHLRIGQKSEARPGRILDRTDAFLSVIIVAHAEEDEIAVLQPLQEGQCFVELAPRNGRMLGPQILRGGAQARAHRRPILGDQLHLAHDRFDLPAERIGRLGVANERNVNVDEALARPAATFPRARIGKIDQLPLLAVHREDRMEDQLHRMTFGVQLAEHRIEDERPIGRGDLDRRHRPALQICLGDLGDAHRSTRSLFPEEIEGGLRDRCERGRRIFHQILRRGAGEEDAGELRRLLLLVRHQDAARLGDASLLAALQFVRQLYLPMRRESPGCRPRLATFAAFV